MVVYVWLGGFGDVVGGFLYLLFVVFGIGEFDFVDCCGCVG